MKFLGRNNVVCRIYFGKIFFSRTKKGFSILFIFLPRSRPLSSRSLSDGFLVARSAAAGRKVFQGPVWIAKQRRRGWMRGKVGGKEIGYVAFSKKNPDTLQKKKKWEKST